jgi:PAS domain S-box-containing protein
VKTADPAKNRRILVIDDSRALHDDFRKILCRDDAVSDPVAESRALLFGDTLPSAEDAGFKIDSAYQGAEGVELARRALAANQPYAMAFVDVRMPPGIDGIETTAKLWELDANLQVVICTAYSDYDWDQMRERLGRSDRLLILKKPFDVIEVLQMAEALTAKWALARSAQDHIENLEHRIEERSGELTSANTFLRSEIAERKQAEERLMLRDTALRAAANAIVIVDRKGTIIWANPAFATLTGYSVEEVIGQNPRLFKSGRHDLEFYKKLWKTIMAGETWRGEIINRRKDGSLYPEEMTITPLRRANSEITHFIAIKQDITARKGSEAALEKLHRELVDASRQAGMAEVATSVLHNVGNVLNSVNVSATLVAEALRKSKAGNLDRVATLLESHASDLAEFMTTDPQGQNLPGYLRALSTRLAAERYALAAEVNSLHKNIEHIKDIVAMQQNYAHVSGRSERVDMADLVEDTLRMNEGSFSNHNVRAMREFAEAPSIIVEKHKVLQILVNLVRNAKQACDASERPDKTITLRVFQDDGKVKVAVADNGVGIPAENLTKIFNHGFTTKKDGHGFGLHSSANAAREMGGLLVAESDGMGQGAVFTLELPLQPQKSHA